MFEGLQSLARGTREPVLSTVPTTGRPVYPEETKNWFVRRTSTFTGCSRTTLLHGPRHDEIFTCFRDHETSTNVHLFFLTTSHLGLRFTFNLTLGTFETTNIDSRTEITVMSCLGTSDPEGLRTNGGRIITSRGFSTLDHRSIRFILFIRNCRSNEKTFRTIREIGDQE